MAKQLKAIFVRKLNAEVDVYLGFDFKKVACEDFRNYTYLLLFQEKEICLQ